MNCRVCGLGTDVEVVLGYWRCAECGVDSLAADPVVLDRSPEAEVWALVSAVDRRRRSLFQMLFLSKTVKEVRLSLDIGCGRGDVSLNLHALYGCEMWGIEIDPGRAAYARGRGVRVWASLDEMPSVYCDLAVLIHALEHLEAPVGVLHQLRARWLWVEVPNRDCTPAYRPDHATAYNKQALLTTVKLAGWQVVDSVEYGLPLSEVEPRNLMVLCTKDCPPRGSELGGVGDATSAQRWWSR